jgi:predicted 3-demethylubiquinone-9 3-methyltransferase (glyoxalase superfamily)
MQKISPSLWFDDQAEKAAGFYTSIFDNAKTVRIARYGDGGPGRKGSVLTVTFQLEGQDFTPAISFFVSCKTQEEIDRLWEKLSEGGEKGQCGWLTDKYGVSWQIVPSVLGELIGDMTSRSEKVMAALMKMTKLDIKALQDASGSAR